MQLESMEGSEMWRLRVMLGSNNGYINALYQPSIEADWNHEWGTNEDVTITIKQPIKSKHDRFNIQPGTVIPSIDTTIKEDKYPSMSAWTPKKNYNLVIEDLKQVGDGYQYKIKVKNIPTSGVDNLTGCLYFVPFITDDSVQWVKKCFTISKGLVSGESIKTVPAH